MNRRQPPADWIPGVTPPSESRPRGRPRVETPLCARGGCGNHVRRNAHKYCSIECRNIVLAPVYAQRAREREARKAETRQYATSPELREAFRLAADGVAAVEWPRDVREAYNQYARVRRQKLADRRPPQPDRSPELQEAFQLLARHVTVSEWPEGARLAYNAYQKERRQIREAERHHDPIPIRQSA